MQVTEAVLAAARQAAGPGGGYVAMPQILGDPEVARNIRSPSRVVGIMSELENAGLVRLTVRGGTGAHAYQWYVPGVITEEES